MSVRLFLSTFYSTRLCTFFVEQIFLALFLCGLLSSCSNASVPFPSKTLRLAFQSAPTTLDPRKSGDFISSSLICLIYEGLTRSLPEKGVECALAERIDISSDKLVYIFHLRPSCWTDGHPVTAEDFEKSWKQILDPSFPSLCAYLLFPIKNAEKCAKGEISASKVGIKAMDPLTLRVELERPTPYFLSLTAFPLFLPVPSHLPAISADHPVVNGPFQIEKIIPNAEVRLIKNHRFWNVRQTPLDAIRISIIPDENTALQLFERGELDWLGTPFARLPLDALPSLEKTGKCLPISMDASTIVAFNTTRFPFCHQKLRQALAMSLDRDRQIRNIASAGYAPAPRCLPSSLCERPRHSEAGSKPLWIFDIQTAQNLFSEALEELHISVSDLEPITLMYKMGQTEKLLAQVLQKQWQETLGLKVEIEGIDPAAHMEKLHHRDFQVALACWIAQFHDPINILERYRLASNPKNFAGWEHPEYANLLERAGRAQDDEVRLDLLEQAEELLAMEIPVFPLYHWRGVSLAHPRIEHIAMTLSGMVLFEKFTLREEIADSAQ